MPVFYFNVSNDRPIADGEGTELPDVDAAWVHAHAVAAELKSHSFGMMGHAWSDLTMSACDANGQEVFSFPMSDVAVDEPGTTVHSGPWRTVNRDKRH